MHYYFIGVHTYGIKIVIFLRPFPIREDAPPAADVDLPGFQRFRRHRRREERGRQKLGDPQRHPDVQELNYLLSGDVNCYVNYSGHLTVLKSQMYVPKFCGVLLCVEIVVVCEKKEFSF